MTRREQSAKRPKGGFTLIEVMIAFGLMALVMMGLQLLLVSTIRANATASSITAAITLAQEKIELLRNTPYDNIPLTSGTSETLSPYTRSLVVAAGPATNTRNVTVSVRWSSPDGSKTVQLNTVLTN